MTQTLDPVRDIDTITGEILEAKRAGGDQVSARLTARREAELADLPMAQIMMLSYIRYGLELRDALDKLEGGDG